MTTENKESPRFTEQDVEIVARAISEAHEPPYKFYAVNPQYWQGLARAALTALTAGRLLVPREITDDMKSAYREAVYYTTDPKLLPENIWRAVLATLTPNQDEDK